VTPPAIAVWRTTAGVALAVLLAACSARPAGEAGTSPALTHGTAIGEVSDTSAVLWGRCNGGGMLHVRLGDAGPDAAVAVDAARDFTGRIALADLTPDTHYTYRAWCSADGVNGRNSGALSGRFVTRRRGSASSTPGGDLGGQNVCRDALSDLPSARTPDVSSRSAT
jgi:alkaline phosphatase D